jgi:hypothetical protein
MDAVVKLEKLPDSEGRQKTLQEKIEVIKAQEDPQIKQLAKVLLKKLEEITEDKQTINRYKITGDVGVNGDYAHVEGGIHFKS